MYLYIYVGQCNVGFSKLLSVICKIYINARMMWIEKRTFCIKNKQKNQNQPQTSSFSISSSNPATNPWQTQPLPRLLRPPPLEGSLRQNVPLISQTDAWEWFKPQGKQINNLPLSPRSQRLLLDLNCWLEKFRSIEIFSWQKKTPWKMHDFTMIFTCLTSHNSYTFF